MIDYKQIADDYPDDGDDLAYLEKLKAETISSRFDICLKTYTDICYEVGFKEANLLEQNIKQAIPIGLFPEWIDKALNGDGIDINNTQILIALDALVHREKSTFTDDMLSKIIATGAKLIPRYPGIQIEHIRKAWHLRNTKLI